MGRYEIPDGNEEIRADLPLIVGNITRTSRWVNPEAFRQLPVWSPWAARGRQLYDIRWTKKVTNTRRSTGETVHKREGNVTAGDALFRALGLVGKKPPNWTVCHVWGYDDPAFASADSVVHDARFFSCVANMI
jgi:hypothetical protein